MGPLLLPLVIMANLFGVGMIVPQAIRLHRTRVADGVSATWVGLSLAMNLWWLGYGLQGRLWGLVPVSIGALVVYGIVAVQVLSVIGPRARFPMAAGAIGPSLVLLGAYAMAGWTTVGLTLGLAYGLQFAPAAVSATRAADTGGVSPSTWIMALTEAVIWVVYGLSVADEARIIGGAGGALVASVIVVRLAACRAARSIPEPLAT